MSWSKQRFRTISEDDAQSGGENWQTWIRISQDLFFSYWCHVVTSYRKDENSLASLTVVIHYLTKRTRVIDRWWSWIVLVMARYLKGFSYRILLSSDGDKPYELLRQETRKWGVDKVGYGDIFCYYFLFRMKAMWKFSLFTLYRKYSHGLRPKKALH